MVEISSWPLRAHFKGTDLVEKSVLIVENATSIVISAVFCQNEYAY